MMATLVMKKMNFVVVVVVVGYIQRVWHPLKTQIRGHVKIVEMGKVLLVVLASVRISTMAPLTVEMPFSCLSL